jgi:hypothetical protein
MSADCVGNRGVGADSQPDPVGDRQACVAACLLDDPDDVTRRALGGQFRRYGRVERDQADAAGQGRYRVWVGRDQAKVVLGVRKLDASCND